MFRLDTHWHTYAFQNQLSVKDFILTYCVQLTEAWKEACLLDEQVKISKEGVLKLFVAFFAAFTEPINEVYHNICSWAINLKQQLNVQCGLYNMGPMR